jgi:REP element-mobilizing transposase RayT
MTEDDPLPQRRRLHHDVPHWVEDGALYFITINCAARGSTQLTAEDTADTLLDAARFYHEQGRWHITLWLLMPDHLHAILGFPRGVAMAETFKAWKRFTARQCGVVWQDGFFDHRLRDAQEENAKYHYVRHNPVRQHLCARPEDWPHQWRWNGRELVRGGR